MITLNHDLLLQLHPILTLLLLLVIIQVILTDPSVTLLPQHLHLLSLGHLLYPSTHALEKT